MAASVEVRMSSPQHNSIFRTNSEKMAKSRIFPALPSQLPQRGRGSNGASQPSSSRKKPPSPSSSSVQPSSSILKRASLGRRNNMAGPSSRAVSPRATPPRATSPRTSSPRRTASPQRALSPPKPTTSPRNSLTASSPRNSAIPIATTTTKPFASRSSLQQTQQRRWSVQPNNNNNNKRTSTTRRPTSARASSNNKRQSTTTREAMGPILSPRVDATVSKVRAKLSRYSATGPETLPGTPCKPAPRSIREKLSKPNLTSDMISPQTSPLTPERPPVFDLEQPTTTTTTAAVARQEAAPTRTTTLPVTSDSKELMGSPTRTTTTAGWKDHRSVSAQSLQNPGMAVLRRKGDFTSTAVLAELEMMDPCLRRALEWLDTSPHFLTENSCGYGVRVVDMVKGDLYKSSCEILHLLLPNAESQTIKENGFDFAYQVLNTAGCWIQSRDMNFFHRHHGNLSITPKTISHHKWLCENILERLAAVSAMVDHVLLVVNHFTYVETTEEMEKYDAEEACLLWVNSVCSVSGRLGVTHLLLGALSDLVNDTTCTKHLAFVMCFLFPDVFDWHDLRDDEESDASALHYNWKIVEEACKLLKVTMPYERAEDWSNMDDPDDRWLRIAFIAAIYREATIQHRSAGQCVCLTNTTSGRRRSSSVMEIFVPELAIEDDPEETTLRNDFAEAQLAVEADDHVAVAKREEEEDDSVMDASASAAAVVQERARLDLALEDEEGFQAQSTAFMNGLRGLEGDEIAQQIRQIGTDRMSAVVQAEDFTGADLEEMTVAQLLFLCNVGHS